MLSHSNTIMCFSFIFIFDVRFFFDFLILHREIVQITAKTKHCKLYIECLSNCDIRREIHVLAVITAFVIGSKSIGNTCTKVAEQVLIELKRMMRFISLYHIISMNSLNIMISSLFFLFFDFQ